MYILMNPDNTVGEIIPTYDPDFPGVPIEDRYEESFIKTLMEFPDDMKVEQNWEYDPKTKTFSAPKPIPMEPLDEPVVEASSETTKN